MPSQSPCPPGGIWAATRLWLPKPETSPPGRAGSCFMIGQGCGAPAPRTPTDHEAAHHDRGGFSGAGRCIPNPRYLAWGGGLLPAGWRSSGRPSSEPAAAQFMIAEGFARRFLGVVATSEVGRLRWSRAGVRVWPGQSGWCSGRVCAAGRWLPGAGGGGAGAAPGAPSQGGEAGRRGAAAPVCAGQAGAPVVPGADLPQAEAGLSR